MSSNYTSESDADFSRDMLHEPIKTRSYYNSNNRNMLHHHSGTPVPVARNTEAMSVPAACKPGGSIVNWRQGNFDDLTAGSGNRSMNGTTPSSVSDMRTHRERIKICGHDIGPILGRNGSTVARLERQCNVTVSLDRHHLVLTVFGRQASQVREALAAIRKIMEENSHKIGSAAAPAPAPEPASMPEPAPDAAYATAPGPSATPVPAAIWRARAPTSQTTSLPHLTKAALPNWRSPSFRRSTTDAVRRGRNGQRRARWEPASKYWEKGPSIAPIAKSTYREASELTALTDLAVTAMRVANNNTIVSFLSERNEHDSASKPSVFNIPRPIWLFEQAFAQYGNDWPGLLRQRFKQPSPIQAQAWPILLQGHDLIGIAQTGTGKTLAFLLPALIHTDLQMRERGAYGPYVLVLVPVRELAAQIDEELKSFNFGEISSLVIVGGSDRRAQLNGRSAHLIIATPGRLIDLLEAQEINFSRISYVVLDEADRMLDMGFEPQIRRILKFTRSDRQTVMISATWPHEVRRLAQSFTRNAMQVCIGTEDLAATHSVKQLVCVLHEHDKFAKIIAFISQMARFDKVIIFCGTKARASDLSLQLMLHKFNNALLHGSLNQHERQQALTDIRTGYVRVLIATDLAARGLDIEDVTHVVNFDFPNNIEEYVHRVGRTGRAGRSGISISYFTQDDWSKAKELILILEEAKQEVPPELRHMADNYVSGRQQRRRAPSGVAEPPCLFR